MIAAIASLLFPRLSRSFVAATLEHLDLSNADVHAALARRLMQSKGYAADVPISVKRPPARSRAAHSCGASRTDPTRMPGSPTRPVGAKHALQADRSSPAAAEGGSLARGVRRHS